MEDTRLIEQLKCGNDEAFRIVINRYQKMVLNTCYRFVLNKETAEDLTQEVFIEVFRSIGAFRRDSKLSTWIYRIAISKSLDNLKSMKRKKRFANLKSLFHNENSAEDNSLENEISLPENQNPCNILEDKERLKILSCALDSLPESQRIAFTLSKYDGYSYNEIAEILDVSNSSVESLIHRAKNNLKKKLYFYYKKHVI